MRVVILLALVTAAMAAPEKVQRIEGGVLTTVDRHPYMANMQFHLWGLIWEHWCGGSLISPTVILSAAHCYVGYSPVQWRVRLGTSFASHGGSVHLVSRIIIHEQYNQPTALNNDVAVLHLATAAVLSDTIRPIGVAGTNYNLPVGTSVSVTGWGINFSIGIGVNGQLMTANNNIINQQECVARYEFLKSQPDFRHWPDVTNTMLCVGVLEVGGRGACEGDDGGPVVHDGSVVVGVISWAFGCGDPFYPGVNARVSSMVDWIVANSN